MTSTSPLLPLLLALTLASLFASCRSGDKPGASAGATPSASAMPPPGMVEATTDTFKQDVQQNPEDPVAHYNLGTGYVAEGKYAEASGELKFVESPSAKDSDALAKLGIAYASAGKLDEA